VSLGIKLYVGSDYIGAANDKKKFFGNG